MANGRERKNTVFFSLENDGDIIEGDENLLNHASSYYADLFESTTNGNCMIDPNIWNGVENVSKDDNNELHKPFFESEIKDALSNGDK